ncbi:hypothetical protein [Methylocystis sp. SB2]|uniref:hypothetical protein n=1 Tax=Methylocystis sp. (strain SB2) TaxID=743836 RepID=UPI0012ED3720|nr:hypothetical protein [Methylocystis sp. SB2]ULO24729.1 hypothetical protein LNB28_04845 [Methylocystis sp. SB2]
MLTDLQRRSEWIEALAVALDNSEGLSVSMSANRLRAAPCSNCLAVATIVPGWGFGWRSVLKSEEVHEILSLFMHYARQYIHRSDVTKVLMAVWEMDGRILHPFASSLISQRYGVIEPAPSRDEALSRALESAKAAWGPATEKIRVMKSDWLARNTLDPFIHQAIFHFLRAEDLRRKEYYIEATVAFDCVVELLGSFLVRRKGLDHSKSRHWVCQELGLSSDQSELANYVCFIRNEHGAHAGGWRWWDQSELLCAGDMGEISAMVSAALAAGADAEPTMRIIEPNPEDCAAWFLENFETLWDAVWFERLGSAPIDPIVRRA